ncbi:hypothetical protein P22_4027 [Propionispora sp. 2/2-37]|uniref:CRISPR-associated endoribonuclease Cas6 n=1 Tax=Propionispora sp. 2/2-37 TaxID=1677858 RepID=UPI0006C5DEE0|nr:CRISPR-associated endoribonuclease Cas6 [Propionispora sp. 2/2-37]CUH97876.1 hypothetical protein P22_4027 [Propionispora sp. 2/2-37]
MHITLRMKADNQLILAIDYNHIVQSTIYHSIDAELADRLHGQGFVADGRVFRLFSFSRLTGPFTMDKQCGQITFTGDVDLVISSPVMDFIQSLANGLLKQGGWRLGTHWVEICEISAEQMKVDGSSVLVKTLSPITVYSTMLRPDGRKYTAYFQPGDPDYDAMITANLQKKYKAFYGQPAPEGMVQIKPRGNVKMNLLRYKGIIIKGYSGVLGLEGPQELLQMAVDGGLGSKNAQGMGCVKCYKPPGVGGL